MSGQSKVASDDSTLQIRMAAILVLMMTGNQNVQWLGGL
jgi:hypothetical protein